MRGLLTRSGAESRLCVELLRNGDIYWMAPSTPPVQLPHLNTTSPSRERASRAPPGPLPYTAEGLGAPVLEPHPYPPCAYGCPLLHGSRSPRLRYPLTAHFAGETMLCLHPRIVASALDIMERLRPEQHSPCNGI